MLDAREHGAQILTGCEVTGLLRRGDRVCGVQVYDRQLHQARTLYAGMVVNAAGIWGQRIAEYADLRITMFPAKGSLLILDHRINNLVINRCRKPADADILVPGDTISLIGTTSMHIPYDEIDDNRVTAAEVDTLLREGEKLAPVMGRTRILRAYSGVRPLVASDNDPSGRGVSRGIVLLDHAQRDGMEGFITITGGKLMTYRLMAEWPPTPSVVSWETPPPVPRPKPRCPVHRSQRKVPCKRLSPSPPRCAARPSTVTAIAPRPGLATAASTVAWSANVKPSLPVK